MEKGNVAYISDTYLLADTYIEKKVRILRKLWSNTHDEEM